MLLRHQLFCNNILFFIDLDLKKKKKSIKKIYRYFIYENQKRSGTYKLKNLWTVNLQENLSNENDSWPCRSIYKIFYLFIYDVDGGCKPFYVWIDWWFCSSMSSSCLGSPFPTTLPPIVFICIIRQFHHIRIKSTIQPRSLIDWVLCC